MSDFDDSDAFEAAAAPVPQKGPLSQRAMAARPAPYLDGLNAAQRAAVEALSDAIGALLMPPLLVFPLLALAWFVGFEASSRQATPGKRLLGLRVVDVDGRGIGLLRAVQRHLAGTLSWLTLNIGHLLAALPPQRLALHDRIAGTRVVQVAGTGALPGWARAWLGLLAVASVGALAWLFVVASAAMQRAFEAMLY